MNGESYLTEIHDQFRRQKTTSEWVTALAVMKMEKVAYSYQWMCCRYCNLSALRP